MFSAKKLGQSFKHALDGFPVIWKKEQSFRIQFVIAVLALLLSFVFGLNLLGKAILALACGFVLGLELLNAQLERIMDIVQPNFDPRVKEIKDLSASAVLVAVSSAFLAGLFLLLFYVL